MNYLEQLAKDLIPKACQLKVKLIYFRIRSILYRGNHVICPCCSGYFRKFLSYGPNLRLNRSNAECPRCGSLERHRLTWLYLKNKTNFLSRPIKVLHFSPEYIFQKNFENLPNMSYISADLTSPLAMLKMDITNILFDDNLFDIILCFHVLEHVVDDRKAMSELYRVLKPGGWAIIQAPIDFNREKTFENPNIILPKDRKRVFGQKDHVRIYGRDYINRLETVGFKVIVNHYARKLGDHIIKKYVLNKAGYIIFCIKK